MRLILALATFYHYNHITCMESPNFFYSILVMLALDFHGLWLLQILTGLIMTESCKKEDLASPIEAGWITQLYEVQSNVSRCAKGFCSKVQCTTCDFCLVGYHLTRLCFLCPLLYSQVKRNYRRH